MYENAAAERVTVYITAALPDGKPTPTSSRPATALDAFYWANDKITCTVVGDLPEAEMQTVAQEGLPAAHLARRTASVLPARLAR